jgi:hypothetical protein
MLLRYHAVLTFKGEEPILFTAVDLDRLLARFNSEVRKYAEICAARGHYIWIEPRLEVEVR